MTILTNKYVMGTFVGSFALNYLGLPGPLSLVPNPVDYVVDTILSGTGRAFSRNFNEENAQEFGKRVGKFFEAIGNQIADSNVNVIDRFNGGISWSLLKNYAPLGLVYVGVMIGIPLSLNYLYERLKYNIGKPKMAMKTREYTFLSALNPFSSSENEKAPQPAFNAEITRRIKEITSTTTNIKNNKGYFQNVLLWGPGGTGKTMISEMIAINSEMNYVMMSGAQLGQFIRRGEHVSELNRLFARARNSELPTIIFIDECEALCKDRGSGLSQEHIEILDTFLNLTGTPDKKVMIVMATNRIQDLDPAVLSRMDHKIFIGPPELEERSRIISMYAKQFFAEYPRELTNFFSPEKINELAIKIEGFTGRSIFKLINLVAAKKAATVNNYLTQEIIDEAINDFKKQEEEAEQMRLEKQLNRNPALQTMPESKQGIQQVPLNNPISNLLFSRLRPL